MKRIRRHFRPRTVLRLAAPPDRLGHGRRHSVALRSAQRGLTLLEIMIVIAILGLLMGLVVVPQVMKLFGKSKEDLAKIAVEKYAYETYPQWKTLNSGKECPESLLVLAQFMEKGEKATLDPWETPYEMYCGKENMPAGATGSIAVMSYGPDKKKGTEDDIKSWDRK